ncbi:protein phosphatase 1 regulatory subunit 36 [Cebidichthys violaceus]|uniref:protein phosphatase 1 regulatory subunit 36 n=1 Tax=Cebidichthys violaceus TaxID=271503 RepID=UPI0035CA699F
MEKYPDEPRHVSVPPSGRWVWGDETRTVEFVSSSPTREGVLRKRRQTDINIKDLQLRSEWLAEIYMLNHRGRQSLRKGLSQAPLHAYRSSVMRRQGDRITTNDVKQVAVGLLQENHSLPVPVRFLAVLKSKEIDEVLTALLLYLCCFFDHKSLENTSKSFMTVDIITELKMRAEALAKKEIAQKKLAVCYFSLIMDLEVEQHQHTSCHKGRMSSNSTEWLLHACLYSFLCYVAWVTFGRRDLKDIQDEVGRLLYSDTFNTAVRKMSDRDSGMTFAAVNGSVKKGVADPKEAGCKSTLKRRTSQRRPALSSIVNQRSPLMVSLLPSPKERSPHLFPGSRGRRRSPPLQAERCDTEALTEELNQRLASVSFGILGKPLRQFSRSTLIPYGEEKNNRVEDDNHEPHSDVNDSEDRPGIHVRGGRSSVGPRVEIWQHHPHVNTTNSAATSEAATSVTE